MGNMNFQTGYMCFIDLYLSTLLDHFDVVFHVLVWSLNVELWGMHVHDSDMHDSDLTEGVQVSLSTCLDACVEIKGDAHLLGFFD